MSRPLALFASPLQLLAALAFFLPFYTVSCQGRPLSTASGYEVATEGFRVDERAERKLQRASEQAGGTRDAHGSTSWLLLFPLLAAAAGAAALLAGRTSSSAAARAKARIVSAALGALGVVLLVVHYLVVRSDLRRLLSDDGGDGMAGAMSRAITLELQVGWYASLLALLGGTALVAAAHVLAQPARPAPAAADPAAPAAPTG
jgi:hypothetical protein